MKTISTILLTLAITVGSASPAMAQTTRKSTAATTKKTATTGISQSDMTDARCLGLYGPVKSVQITSKANGETSVFTYKFNTRGQLTSKTRWGETQTYVHQNANKYRRDSTPVVVIYGKNKRVDSDNEGEQFSTTYTFSPTGQLTSIFDNHDFANNQVKYYYRSTTSKLPYKEKHEGSEGGEVWGGTTTYQYLASDSHGNWTKRKVNGKYTETQVITYY